MKLISTKICKTSDIGINNNLFGGTMLSWLDEAGGTMASEVACTLNMVTLKIDEVIFKKPVKVNQHIRIYGKVTGVGKTSVTLYIEARRFDFQTQAEETVCSTKAIFVRINEDGDAFPIQEDVRLRLQQLINNQ